MRLFREIVRARVFHLSKRVKYEDTRASCAWQFKLKKWVKNKKDSPVEKTGSNSQGKKAEIPKCVCALNFNPHPKPLLAFQLSSNEGNFLVIHTISTPYE